MSPPCYIKTCQGTKVGDNVDQAYADRIVVASLVNDGIEAYDQGRYRDALDVYQSALRVRANARPDDRLREAIQNPAAEIVWIASSLRSSQR